MATLREYFDTDFTRAINTAQQLELRHGTNTFRVLARIHMDFDANAKFISCYLDEAASTASVCNYLVAHSDELLKPADGVEIHTPQVVAC
jgi:hypothetical protein